MSACNLVLLDYGMQSCFACMRCCVYMSPLPGISAPLPDMNKIACRACMHTVLRCFAHACFVVPIFADLSGRASNKRWLSRGLHTRWRWNGRSSPQEVVGQFCLLHISSQTFSSPKHTHSHPLGMTLGINLGDATAVSRRISSVGRFFDYDSTHAHFFVALDRPNTSAYIISVVEQLYGPPPESAAPHRLLPAQGEFACIYSYSRFSISLRRAGGPGAVSPGAAVRNLARGHH